MKNHDPTSDPSIRSTIHSASSSTLDIKNDTTVSETSSIHDISNTYAAPVPSMKLLFSFLTPRRKLVLLTPAILSSVATGAIAPLMTYAVGQSFNAFAAFPLTSSPPQSAKDALLHGVGIAAIELVALGISALVMSSITSSLWISTGEHNVVELRRLVYQSVVNKEMSWFDLRMGVDGSAPAGHVQDTSEDSPVGAGGLMARFARETDEVRAASSLAAGQLLQYLTTIITSLVLAFVWSPLLTLVILSAAPALIIIQAFSQVLAGPLLARERTFTASAATVVERAVSAIATVKAFNAATHETRVLSRVLGRVRAAANGLASIWGPYMRLEPVRHNGMFVQGFWFGAHLVREGKNTPGQVMSVFWACLIATSNLQMAVPLLITFMKGKVAAAELAGMISEARQPSSKHRLQELQKIQPKSFYGELSMTDVCFAYPARPDVQVLHNVTMYLPARETTFIVGSSGSGKSTLGAILMGIYNPNSGYVCLDEQDVRYIDAAYVSGHIAGVAQGASSAPVFPGSLHENVALGAVGKGKRPEDVTRAEVEEACRVAMLESWVVGLDQGYETLLSGTGAEGIQLSGGQRQRLAIARARIRDPEILILDEATSALDPPTRALILAAIRRWRQDRTTIIITHDVAAIEENDFVYVMREGSVVEQGFRSDLEHVDDEFARMLRTGGLAVEDDLPEYDAVAAILAGEEEEEEEPPVHERHMSVAPTLGGMRPVTATLGNWMFDVVAELTKSGAPSPPPLPTAAEKDKDWRMSRFIPPSALPIEEMPEFKGGAAGRQRRPSSMSLFVPEITVPPRTYGGHRFSLQFTPTSPTFSRPNFSVPEPVCMVEIDEEFETEKETLKRSAEEAANRRERRERKYHGALQSVVVPPSGNEDTRDQSNSPAPGLFALLRAVYPTIPTKPIVFVGLIICLLSGAMTPIFSFLLSRLIVLVSAGGSDASRINSYGGLVLGIAALDGLLLGSKFFFMETSAMRWVTHLRDIAFSRVLSQDKSWFDRPENGAARLTQVIVKDGDDARQIVAVGAMMMVGLLWAMAWGWQLTLVGLAIGPVFVGVMGLQTNLMGKCEVRNKRAREEVARVYYESILNVRGIRAMSLEPVLQAQFDKAASQCLSTGIRGAFVEGCSYGVASALIYLAEALLFYVGAVLIAKGTYTYLQMCQVLNLVVFTVSIGSQLMSFTQKIAKSVLATHDLYELIKLDTTSSESQGILRPRIEGDLVFKDVSFSYPTNPDVSVLNKMSMRIADGECVAIVGTSGCGKSTVASLLQRLYEPTSGTISVGLNELRATDIDYLRDHVAVVSQTPNLFDASIRENIAYGRVGEDNGMSDADVERAARAANVHEFVMSLPQGYDTLIGENASLISGGQAQRLQVARALGRPAKILILDECTSALDPANQTAVLETIRAAKVGRTTIMVTHKVPVMKMCDRILVIEDGQVREQGTYESLIKGKGLFARLANGGEWVSE
ncbi:P-loop containing nucleoside triphosphate hydrolase protein [Suillus subaureus]|uniref:P-loop containing nucleoside triphosphate hydrolase protein n=1 Tax=Suillus subaureus TaxID=48587 RepID=A0A9P7DXL4_9AGAM|nr:P-loop containing nucleoside triphosphate hydrolase protein [Suillus subaureus]KAG1805465.1 P-loop containing nucleoside triphosphate hydrolase protein [Suillus subaureus]